MRFHDCVWTVLYFFCSAILPSHNNKNRKPINSFFFFFCTDIWSNIKPHLHWRFLYVFLHFYSSWSIFISVVVSVWAHENYVISIVLHRWFSAQRHHSQSIRRCLAELTGRSFVSHQVDLGQSITVQMLLCNVSVSWKSYIFTFGFCCIFTLTDIILQHAEGVIWPLCLWKPFKANCRFFLSFFFFFSQIC